VHVALKAVQQLQREGIGARLVSLPSWEIFAGQTPEYREKVLPAAVRTRVAIEAAATFGWHRWVGETGRVLGIDHFGASAPADQLFKEFGFTPEKVVEAVKGLLQVPST